MYKKLTEYLANRAELSSLAKADRLRAANRDAAPALPALETLNARRATWRIAVPDQADRFMSATSGQTDDEIFVVQLDTEAFYAAWLRSTLKSATGRGDHCVRRSQMKLDYKFSQAAKGFAEGQDNPVPLAVINASHDPSGLPRISFTDGVTRSFWLIANRVESFPASVYGAQTASLLNNVAGLTPAPMSYAQLFAQAPAANL